MIMPRVVYFSSLSGNTHHFVQNLGVESIRIPMSPKQPMPEVSKPYVLVCPCYAGDDGSGAVPKQVIRFLNNPENRKNMLGVIAGGNKNFGIYYGYSGDVISKKCNVPLLYRFELRGTPRDVRLVQEGLKKLWIQQRYKDKITA
jgi:protein involved in ribonucleotide reduction